MGIYEKIILLLKSSFLISSCLDKNTLNKLNLKYYIISEAEKNSVLEKTKKFFHEFISNLTDESKIFPYFVNLDAGTGYYNDNCVYSWFFTSS